MSTYEQDTEINPNRLDIEWTKQASLFFRYAKQAAEARQNSDRIKEQLTVVEAELALSIRKNPAKYGLEKSTEAAVQNIFNTDSKRKALAEKQIQAQFELEVLNAAVRALDQKKSALENLVRLHGQNYFAGPSVPNDLGKDWARECEHSSARSLIKERMIKRKG